MTTIKIAKGLKASYKNATLFTLAETLDVLTKRVDCYEVLNDVNNRVYGDIDGRCLESMTESEFKEKDRKTLEVLQDFLKDKKHAIMTASSYIHRKISYRFVLPDLHAPKHEIKKWVGDLKIPFPDGIALDTGVYGNNQKIRMLGSNKDGENRPLRLLAGTVEDTLISPLGDSTLMTYVPDDARRREEERLRKEEEKIRKKEERERKKEEKDEEKEDKKEKKIAVKAKSTVEGSVVLRILNSLDISRIETYASWIQIGMVCFNMDLGWELWDVASKRASNYEKHVCEEKYATFYKGDLTIATLWSWLKEDDPEVFDDMKENDYERAKEEFEITSFKLMNPSIYITMGRDIDGRELLYFSKFEDLLHKYRNFKVCGQTFIKNWIEDKNIKTYDAMDFDPTLRLPKTHFNLFRGFKYPAVKGDFSPITKILEHLCDYNPRVMWYVERYCAHLFQKPGEKTVVILVFQGKQGTGKDMFWNIIGDLMGDYFLNTLSAENDVFCKFNDLLMNKLFIKFEESNYLTNKDHDNDLKALSAADSMKYEGKGMKSITMKSFANIVMTTNNDTPVVVEDSERRYMLVKTSSKWAKNPVFWDPIVAAMKGEGGKAIRSAYLDHLLNLDISDFSPRNDRVLTPYYYEVAGAFTPYHSRFFQRIVEQKWESDDEDMLPITFRGRELVTKINETMKPTHAYTDTRIGRDLKEYPDNVLGKVRQKCGMRYTIYPEPMIQYLKDKGWFQDFS
jgi:hypothetical protein